MEREMCLMLRENDNNKYEGQEFEHIEHSENIVTSFIRISKGQFLDQYNVIKEIVHDEETDRIKIGSGDLAVSPAHSVHVSYSRDNLEDRGNTLNPSSLRVIRLPSNSSGFVSLSNLEKAFFEDSILRCGILNQIMANISSLENLRKSSSLVTNTLDSDLENLANLPFDSPLGFDIILTPCSLRNFSNLSSTFSSERNLINWDVDDNIFFASCDICRVLESCHDMFFGQGGECFEDFFKGRSILEHLKNLPDHNSSTFKSGLTVTNLAVRNDILVDFNSHNINNTKELYKYFGNLYIRDKMKRETCLALGENDCRGYGINSVMNSFGEKTLALDDFRPLSPDRIGDLVASDSAIYGTSFGCGAIDSASDKNCENSSVEIGVIMSESISYTSLNSFSDNLVSSRALDLCFLTSSNKNSGAINLNLFNIAFNKIAINEVPLFISSEITTLASITNLLDIIYSERPKFSTKLLVLSNIATDNLANYLSQLLYFENDFLYLLASEMLISSANSFADFSVNLDFDTICLNFIIFDSLSFNNSARSMDRSILDIVFNSDSNSSGMDIVNSAMRSRGDVNYINVSVNSNFNKCYVANSDNYSPFCPEFSKGQFLKIGDTINRIVHNRNYENSALRCSINSNVVNTFTINCSLKWESSDQIGVLFIDKERARYSVSSLSEISSLALVRNISNSFFGRVVILDFNSSISSSSFSVERPDSSLMRDLCLFSSSKIYSGAYSSILSENIISFVTPVPVKAINNSAASITNFINISYLSFGYNFLYLRCNDLFNSFPSLKAFSLDNLDSDAISLNFLYCSSSDSFLAFLTNSSAALANTNPSLFFNLEGMSTFIIISSIGELWVISYLNLFCFLLIEIKMIVKTCLGLKGQNNWNERGMIR